jgi:hypothetical protein
MTVAGTVIRLSGNVTERHGDALGYCPKDVKLPLIR